MGVINFAQNIINGIVLGIEIKRDVSENNPLPHY